MDNVQNAKTAIHKMVEAAQDHTLDRVIYRLPSGWAIMGETQVLRGYCLLLPDPVVPNLNALTGSARQQFLADMAALGDAVLTVTGCVRVNYEMLGNLEPALHAHIVPRFLDEPEELKTKPVWYYDWETAPRFDPLRDAGLLTHLRQYLENLPR